MKYKQNLKSILINEGINEIKKEGISNISLRKITGICGVSHSSLYKYFPHKKDYIDAIMNKLEFNFNQFILKGTEKIIDNKEKLIRMGINHVIFAKCHTNEFDALFLNKIESPINVNSFNSEQYPSLKSFTKIINDLLISSTDENILSIYVHLWSYIVGLSIIVAKNNIISNEDWIENNIRQMVNKYFENSI